MKYLYHFILVLFSLSISLQSNAQWEPFNDDQQAHYTDGDLYVGVRFSEILPQTDRKILVPDNDFNCPDCGSHWTGKQIEVFPNGDHILYNAVNEPIFIKSSAKVGDEWTAMTRSNELIIGRCTAKEWTEVLGVMDSVKKIEFRGVKPDGSPSYYSMPEDAMFRISMNYGYIDMVPPIQFPEGIYYGSLNLYRYAKLVGTTKDNLGYQDVKWEEVINFYPGDEMHIRHYRGSYDYYNGYSESEDHFFKYVIESKTEVGDLLIYTVNMIKSSYYKEWYEPVDSSLTTELVEWKFSKSNVDFDRFSCVRYRQQSNSVFNTGTQTEHGPGKVFALNFYEPFDVGDDDGDRYITGAGGPYYSYSPSHGESYGSRQLQYLKTATQETGTPFDPTLFDYVPSVKDTIVIPPVDTIVIPPVDTIAVPPVDTIVTPPRDTIVTPVDSIDINKINILQCYPNPVNEKIFITYDAPSTINSILIYNLNGKLVWKSQQLNEDFIEIAPIIQSGIYLCNVMTSDGKIHMKKIVKL